MNSKPNTTRQVTQITINAPIQKVWDTLTKQGERLPFFFGTVMHTTRFEPGAPIRMRSPDGKYTGVAGDVLEINEPFLYSMTFKFTNYDDDVCITTHELKEVDGGTQYSLIADEVPVGTKTEKQMKGGGKIITSTLKACVETGKPPFLAKFIMATSTCLQFMSPKSSLSSNWPMDKKLPLE